MNKIVGDLKPESEVHVDPLALLRKPFLPHQISKLPKESKAQADARKANRDVATNCAICGGWHHKQAVHLDYVGHAALTDRLLDADPEWAWEPVAFGQDGLPALDRNGGMWIKLSVAGVTRLGYGSADGKQGGDAVKELIGDALRNAAMRFGAALDLWHKGDLHAEPEEPVSTAEEMAVNLLRGCGSKELFVDAWTRNKDGWRKVMDEPTYVRVVAEMRRLAATFAPPPEPAPKPEAASAAPADTLGLGDDEIPF